MHSLKNGSFDDTVLPQEAKGNTSMAVSSRVNMHLVIFFFMLDSSCFFIFKLGFLSLSVTFGDSSPEVGALFINVPFPISREIIVGNGG